MASSRKATPRAASDKPAPEPGRATRPKPERIEPNRTGWAGGTADPPGAATGPQASANGTAAPRGAASEIEDIVNNAVCMGYSVIEEHLRHGRAAADRMSAGSYGVRDVPDDLGKMGSRLLQAARDFTTMWFDFIEAGVRDPRLSNALRRKPDGTAPPRARAPVTLTCSFPGKAATVIEASLTQPEQPALLSIAGLHSPDAKAPMITSVAFLPGAGGVSAVIRIPKDQPAGIYSGVICDAGSHAPLGTVSVRVDQ